MKQTSKCSRLKCCVQSVTSTCDDASIQEIMSLCVLTQPVNRSSSGSLYLYRKVLSSIKRMGRWWRMKLSVRQMYVNEHDEDSLNLCSEMRASQVLDQVLNFYLIFDILEYKYIFMSSFKDLTEFSSLLLTCVDMNRCMNVELMFGWCLYKMTLWWSTIT